MTALVKGSERFVPGDRERRRYPRKDTSVCVWMQFRRQPSVCGVTTSDLSPEGARFTAPLPVRPGEHVMLYLQLEQVAYSIECKGKVCWAESQIGGETSFGVRFLDLRHEEEEQLRETLGPRPSI